MVRKVVPPKILTFVDVYCKTTSSTKAALAAGYPETWARSAGNRLLRTALVQDLIGAKNVDRGIHAEETYRNTIAVTNAALGEMVNALNTPLSEKPSIEERAIVAKIKKDAIDAAGRAIERMGKVEGLYVERVAFQDNREITLQRLIAEFSKAIKRDHPTAMPVIDVTPIAESPKIMMTPPSELPKNGVNGNGHKAEGVA